MSEAIVIHAKDLTKIYRLYNRRIDRFRDMFGLLPPGPGRYREHVAVKGIDLTIRRGEKVAIIGRNGAGKSTLLKLFCKVVTPTSGTLTVNGKLQALLQVGTGFHPDFTGRENVYSYMAQMGIDGAEADERFAEIVEFAELEEYIDQPLKTYSTGMGMRLMFSTSTAISPDILLIDEVLGVGDAYFARKSFDRIKSLCTGTQTTMLLVTHDFYSALGVCERMVWIDRGEVVMDDEGPRVVRAYEASIRLQEEASLRERALRRMRSTAPEAVDEAERLSIYFQIVPVNRTAIRAPLPVTGLELLQEGRPLCPVSMEIGVGRVGAVVGCLVVDDGEGNWGEAYLADGRQWRDIGVFGSIYQRGPFTFRLPKDLLLETLALRLAFRPPTDQLFFLEGYASDGRVLCAPLPTEEATAGGVCEAVIPLQFPVIAEGPGRHRVLGLASHPDLASAGGEIGSRRLLIEDAFLEDAAGERRFIFDPQENVTAVVRFLVQDDTFQGRPTLMFVFHKEGKTMATKLTCDDQEVSPGVSTHYEARAFMRPMLLGAGEYTFTAALFEGDYYARMEKYQHIASTPLLIDIRRKLFTFKVEPSRDLAHFLLTFYQPQSWTVSPWVDPRAGTEGSGPS
jgi:ABC-type polysaccharide/polyol phosphate transport system ATPase subunit